MCKYRGFNMTNKKILDDIDVFITKTNDIMGVLTLLEQDSDSVYTIGSFYKRLRVIYTDLDDLHKSWLTIEKYLINKKIPVTGVIAYKMGSIITQLMYLDEHLNTNKYRFSRYDNNKISYIN